MTVTDQLHPGTVLPTTSLRWLGRGLLVLAGLLTLNTILGPLVLGSLDYGLTETLENQLLGLEVVTMLLVVPWAVTAGVLALRGSPVAPILGFAPSAYAAYMFVQYVLGPEYQVLGLAPLFHLVVASLAGGLMLASWTLSATQPLPQMPSRRERLRALVLVGLAAFVLMRYVGTVAGAISSEPLEEEFADSVTFYWSIVLLDLGVVVPAVLVAAVALWRGSAGGRRGFFAAVGWFALVPPSVAAMAVVMLARDDPHASVTTVLVLGIASLLFAAYAMAVHRPLVRRASPLVLRTGADLAVREATRQ